MYYDTIIIIHFNSYEMKKILLDDLLLFIMVSRERRLAKLSDNNKSGNRYKDYEEEYASIGYNFLIFSNVV